MLFSRLFAGAAFLGLVFAATVEEVVEPEIVVQASFPESNPFGHVVNGEKNQLVLNLENKSERNVTVLGVGGAFVHPGTGALIKNTTSAKLQFALMEGVKFQIPYAFHSELKPGDVRLNIWLEHSADGKVYRVQAYDSIVTVVEPAISIFDFKMLTTYLMVLGIFSGLAYFAYLSFVPQPKTKKARKPITKSDVSPTVGTVTATGAGGYQEEWIPEHHLKKSTRKSKGAPGGMTSGTSADEASELSGTEGRKRKGKK